MQKKNNKPKHRDSKDGTYDYRYMDRDHNRRSIYAATMEALRKLG